MSSPLTIIMGRPTADPVMQQAKNNTQIEYVSLDIATTQRGQNGENETIFVNCYFNKFLAERLGKAGVKHGTPIMVYGDTSYQPFLYQKGAKAGQAGVNIRINVKDWQFVPSNKSENEAGAPQNGMPAANYGGASTLGAGGYQNQGMQNQAAPNQPMPNGNYGGTPGVPNQTSQNRTGYQNPPASYAGGGYPPQNRAPQNYQAAPSGNGYGNNGFSNVQESQLPFPA
ncbi:MAG: single-stranded DNA-binding protein [Eubacteriales bacterium]|nr:single-stranded DNA-binding protein [Eubacteriales bacterium]